MVSVFVFLILAWQFYIGYSRGIILQGYYFVANIISLVFTVQFYRSLADLLTLWVPYSNPLEGSSVYFFKSVDLFDLSQVFYAGIAFFSIYVVAYLIFRFLGIFVHFTKIDRFDKLYFRLISGGLSLLVTICFLGLFFNVLATIPVDLIQDFLNGSWLIRLLIHFPVVSQLVQAFWVSAILK